MYVRVWDLSIRLVHVMMGAQEVCALEQLHIVEDLQRFTFARNLSAV